MIGMCGLRRRAANELPEILAGERGRGLDRSRGNIAMGLASSLARLSQLEELETRKMNKIKRHSQKVSTTLDFILG